MTCYSVRSFVPGHGVTTFWFRDYDRAVDFYYNQCAADYPVRHTYRRVDSIEAAENRIENTIITLRGF